MLTTISKPRVVLTPSPFDAKSCNYYVEGSTIKIESIDEYLTRVVGTIRSTDIVKMLVPKEGYTSLGTYPIAQFATIISNFDNKYYTFVGGFANANFVETLIVTASRSIVGKGTVTEPLMLENDPAVPSSDTFYGTDTSGNRGYYPIIPNLKNALISVEDREWGFADIIAGTVQTYDIDLDVAFNYNILYASLRTDVGTLTCTIKINGVVITGLANIAVTGTKTRTTATALNTVVNGDIVTIETSGTDSGTPTYLGGKIVIQRVPGVIPILKQIVFNVTVPDGGILDLYSPDGLPLTANWGDGTIEDITPINYEYTHTYVTAGSYTVTLTGTDAIDWPDASPFVTDVVSITNIKTIAFYSDNLLTTLDVSNSIVEYIMIENCPNFTSINIDNCFNLIQMDIDQNNFDQTQMDYILTTLTDSRFIALTQVNLTITGGAVPTQSVVDAFVLAHPTTTILYDGKTS